MRPAGMKLLAEVHTNHDNHQLRVGWGQREGGYEHWCQTILIRERTGPGQNWNRDAYIKYEN